MVYHEGYSISGRITSMREVAVIGAGMTRFGKHMDRSMKDLAREAIENALNSSGVNQNALEAVAVGNAMAGLITGQECIRGQDRGFQYSKVSAPSPPMRMSLPV